MNFAIYLPQIALEGKSVPTLYWLSGLTCNEENFMQKAGAFAAANRLGVAIVAPDTSPRGDGVPDAPDQAYDLGLGAGFYVDATQAPWDQHYQMYSYILDELIPLIESSFSVSKVKSITGHSMGGHGALTIGLKNTNTFASVSAFSPICHPSACAWGQKALSHYLGEDRTTWQRYDATLLIDENTPELPIMIDQGSSDDFLAEQLLPQKLLDVAAKVNYPIQYYLREGYDHSYFFISTFIDEHLAFHAQHMQNKS